MRYLLTIIFGILTSFCLISQSQIVLKFTVSSHGYGIPSDSIVVKNLTKGNETRLYYPDTTLIINFSGIENISNFTKKINIKSYPNPFENSTLITFNIQNDNNVKVLISDIDGKIYFRNEIYLPAGIHNFKFDAPESGIFILNILTSEESHSVKLVNISNNSKSKSLNFEKIESEFLLRNTSEIFENFPYNLGDNLKITAYSSLGNSTYYSSPTGDYVYVFDIGEEIPVCEETPLIKDIDGNYYLTVQIGSQCWMQQNLKTTKFRNGDPIPYVYDPHIWEELTSPAFVWYENNIFWKDLYGGLYNFYTVEDSRGICPVGWHVPSEQEWQTLLNFAGGINAPTGNKLKSCRQIGSPLGGDCDTNEHPRWMKDIYGGNYGTDDYYFSALPGGAFNYFGKFIDLGASIFLWTSNEAWDPDYGTGIKINYYDYATEIILPDKKNGSSIRCIKD